MEQERVCQNDTYYVISVTKLGKCPVPHYDLEVWSLVAALFFRNNFIYQANAVLIQCVINKLSFGL